jgi:hypothetical protein
MSYSIITAGSVHTGVLKGENKDAKLDSERSFRHAVLNDFKEFEEAGITPPDIDKIKALLSIETEAR